MRMGDTVAATDCPAPFFQPPLSVSPLSSTCISMPMSGLRSVSAYTSRCASSLCSSSSFTAASLQCTILPIWLMAIMPSPMPESTSSILTFS